jgi:hypothetical protein
MAEDCSVANLAGSPGHVRERFAPQAEKFLAEQTKKIERKLLFARRIIINGRWRLVRHCG